MTFSIVEKNYTVNKSFETKEKLWILVLFKVLTNAHLARDSNT